MANEIKRTWCDGIEMAIDAAEFGPGSTGVVVRCGTRRTCKVCRAHDAQAAAEHAAQEAAATLELIRLAEAFGAVPNRPASAGQEAAGPFFFGGFRFKLFAVHTRGERVSWFVSDAEERDELTGLPAVIRQAATVAEAVTGLPVFAE